MEKMLLIAKEDIESAKLLYNKGKYSNSLYHYHQSVEKAVKYLGLITGKITEKQLNRNIKHTPIKVFKILFAYFSEQTNGFLPPIDKHLFTNAQQIISSESEEYIVEETKNAIQDICKEKKVIDENNFNTPLDAIRDYAKRTFPNKDLGLEDPNIIAFARVALKTEAMNLLLFINYGIKILQILLMNTLLCSKFKPDEFRYSSEKIGNPLSYFNKKNPLIDELPFFINTMELTISNIGKIDWKDLF